jgi:predicted PurR-regulated permease PerM
MNGEKILDISWGTIVKLSIAGLSIYLLYLIRDILIWFVFALIISILFEPAIEFLIKKRIPRIFAVVFVYFAIFGILGLLIYSIVPLFISEIQQFSQFFGQYFDKISPPLKSLGLSAFENLDSLIATLSSNLEKTTSNIFSAITSIFGGIFSTIFIISIAIFISLEEKLIEKTLGLLFPQKYEAFALSLWEKCRRKVSGWFLVKILGCIFVGVFSYIAFLVFSVKYPLGLALLAGIFNFIPIVGPIITGILLFIIVALDSFARAIFVLIAFTIIQQLEGNIFVPLLSKKFIGLSPLLVLIALAVGGELWGIMGAVLAIPLAGILFEFIIDFLKKKKGERPIVL